jgi:hypothetical protein
MRNVMTTIQTLAVFSIIALAALTQGCTSTPQHKHTGFLASYDNLRPSNEFADVHMYTAPGFDKSQLLKINKIHVEDFELWLQSEQLQLLGSAQINDVVVYFAERLRSSLSDYYQIVETADAETLTIRGAFSDIQVSTPDLSPTDFIPFRVVLNAGNAAYLHATDQQELISRVGIEAEFRMGEDKQLVFAMTSAKELDSTVSDNPEGNTQAVKKVLNTWVDNFVAKIREIHLEH